MKKPPSAKRQSETEETGATAGLLWVLRVVRKHWPIIAACALLATGIALIYSKSLPRVYEASALLEFDPDVIRPLPEKSDPMRAFAAFWDNHEYYETQYRIITSEKVLSATARDLNLQTDAEFLGQKPTAPVPMESIVGMLAATVKVEPVKSSRLVWVRVEHENPRQAKRVCDALVRTYVSQNLEKTVNATADAVVWLNGQLDHFKTELESNENALHEFKKRNDLPSSTLEEVSKMIRLEMQAYDEALTHTRTRKQELLARHAELSKVTPDSPDAVPASELLNNGFLSGLRTQFLNSVRERRELAAEGKGDNHPLMRKADEKVAENKRALLDEIKNIEGAVERDLAVIGRQESGEAALYEEARRRAVELNLKELEFHRLDRLRAQNEKLYGALLEQTKEADMARMMNVNNIRLIDAATEPHSPIRPRVPVNLALGTLIGLAFGLALAFLREQLDSSLKTPEDVENYLGISFLGLLPEVDDDDAPSHGKRRRVPVVVDAAKAAPELVVHTRPLSGVAEAARTLRTNLMFMNPDKPFRRLLVTSAAPAEGKTTVACSIAISLAQGGQRVCIVDCDLRRPRLHRIFGRAGDAGLTNCLVGDASLDEVAQPTMIENLWCIPSGPTPPNPGDLLHSERFKKFLSEVSERFDRVILDSPPVVAVSDSAIISALVDGTVFVIRAFSTTRALSKQGMRALRDVDAPLAGAVLNAVNLRKHEYGYYQQYYYYKREGYGPPPGTGAVSGGGDERATAPPPN